MHQEFNINHLANLLPLSEYIEGTELMLSNHLLHSTSRILSHAAFWKEFLSNLEKFVRLKFGNSFMVLSYLCRQKSNCLPELDNGDLYLRALSHFPNKCVLAHEVPSSANSKKKKEKNHHCNLQGLKIGPKKILYTWLQMHELLVPCSKSILHSLAAIVKSPCTFIPMIKNCQGPVGWNGCFSNSLCLFIQYMVSQETAVNLCSDYLP